MLPSSWAHEGQAIPDLFPLQGTITVEDPVHNFPVAWPQGTQTIGDRFTLTTTNEGPGNLQVVLRRDGTDVETWDVAGDGTPRHFVHLVASPGDYSLHFVNPSTTDEPYLYALWDAGMHCNVDPVGCQTKFLPWEVAGGATVFRFVTQGPGTFRTTVENNELHRLALEAYGPDGVTSLGRTEAENSQGRVVLQWTTETAGVHHLVVESLHADEEVYFAAAREGGSAAARETTRITVLTDGPLATGIPGPGAPPLAVGLLALALMVRSKQK